ncbi:metal ABC transporter permease [Virgibacillus sp. C22-A2]|uniref:Metal ABC transporter permease n=1 Tax=Virgibacillus tibetensis TaxID=3042313 RepID=A0ABU6KKP6_9BACI|nr:metal ABC transporter permease [Virgibacillus sp. C22-A2]
MLADFFEYDFLRNTFLTGLLIGIIAPLLGTFIVVRRLSLIADALSHVTLAGIAFGLMLEKKYAVTFISPIYSGMAFSVLGSVFIEKLRGVYKAYQELAIPIILSGGVGLSVIFISFADGFNTELFNYLFGSVSAVSQNDLYTIAGISIFIILVIGLFYKELFTLSFDEEHAAISGIHSKRIHLLFIVLTALVIAASIRIVGVLLVSALMTLPVAASMRLAKGFKQMMFLSIVFGEAAVIIGLISGYYLSIPPGGTIVMVSIIILLLSISVKRFNLSSRKVGEAE